MGVLFAFFLIFCPIAVYVISPGTVRVVIDIGSLLTKVQGVLLAFAALGRDDVQRKLILPRVTASLLLGLLTLIFAIMCAEVPSAVVSLNLVKAAFEADPIFSAITVLILYLVVVHWSAGKGAPTGLNAR